MRLIIAGSRSILDYNTVDVVVKHALASWAGAHGPVTEVLCGWATKGVDVLGSDWAKNHGIPIRYFPADWETYGLKAGPIRNALMADNADACILIWDGVSKGTKSMLREAKKRNLKIYLHKYKGKS